MKFLIILFLVLLPPSAFAEDLRVSRVIDGDTVQLENKEIVRLIGVDTLESRYNRRLQLQTHETGLPPHVIIQRGKEAANYTRSLLIGKRVRLEFDKTKKDRYGRTLAYVYLEDGTFINAELLKSCQAKPLHIKPNVKYQEDFDRFAANC